MVQMLFALPSNPKVKLKQNLGLTLNKCYSPIKIEEKTTNQLPNELLVNPNESMITLLVLLI